jgi:hypothetical protein
MLSAKQAKQIADKNNDSKEEITLVFKAIKKAAKKGLYTINVDCLSLSTIAVLESLNYTVLEDTCSYFENQYYIIEWRLQND